MAIRYVLYSSRDKAEGFIDGVEWTNEGTLHIKGLYKVPTGTYVVVVDDDDHNEIDQPPIGWELCRELDYGSITPEEDES